MDRYLAYRPLDVLFPPTCLLCGASGSPGRDLCPGCAVELPLNRHACPRCALPLDAQLPSGAECGACRRRPPPFDAALAVLRYETPVPLLVGAAKFRGQLAAARLLGQLLADALPIQAGALPEVLIPVPLHPRRLGERGYNQALEIARTVAGALGVAVDAKRCRRVLSTAPQAGLDEAARRRNIRGAFAVSDPLPWRRIAILDDVVTTGSTVAELSRTLRRSGAEEIAVWAVARTP
jgi:ComF family protein